MKVKLTKKINKLSHEDVIVKAGWFVGLAELAERFEKRPSHLNKLLLLGYISSAKFIVSNLIAEDNTKKK